MKCPGKDCDRDLIFPDHCVCGWKEYRSEPKTAKEQIHSPKPNETEEEKKERLKKHALFLNELKKAVDPSKFSPAEIDQQKRKEKINQLMADMKKVTESNIYSSMPEAIEKKQLEIYKDTGKIIPMEKLYHEK